MIGAVSAPHLPANSSPHVDSVAFFDRKPATPSLAPYIEIVVPAPLARCRTKDDCTSVCCRLLGEGQGLCCRW